MGKARILVVEDEGMTALSIKTCLTRAGYDVPGVAAGPDEALRLSREVSPDLVLMDIMLEGKQDGIGAALRIRERFHIPIVYLTAYSDKSTLDRARPTEPFGYLLKPFEERSLLAAVEMSLYKGRMENQLRTTKEKLEAILQCVSDGILLVEMKGTVEYINPAAKQMLGLSEEQTIGRSVSRVLQSAYQLSGEQLLLPFEQVVLDGEAVNMLDVVLLTEDERTISVDIDLSPFWDESGVGRGMVVAIRNVSQRHQLEDLHNGEL